MAIHVDVCHIRVDDIPWCQAIDDFFAELVEKEIHFPICHYNRKIDANFVISTLEKLDCAKGRVFTVENGYCPTLLEAAVLHY